MIFATDFDGVILDFYSMVVESFLKYKRINIKPYWKHYYFKLPNMTDDDIAKLINFTIENETINAKPIEYSIESLRSISSLGIPILIVTNRITRQARRSAYLWSEKYLSGINYSFAFIKGSKTKILRDPEINFFVEDRPENCIDIARLNNIECIFLFEQPYNRLDINKIRNRKIEVVSSWPEILERFINYNIV